jgi:peroxiredoxin
MAGSKGWRLALMCAGLLLSGVICRAAQTPQPRRVAKPVVSEYAPNVPPVFLSGGHAQLCRLLVGDEFPVIELPQLDAGPTKLSTFAGQKATVVLFWTPDQWMSRVALYDVAKNIAANARDSSIGVIGVVEHATPEEAKAAMEKAGAKFSQLLDADGAALAQVGTGASPRVYVIDANRRIAWFDLEYSEATRRELQQTLAALTASK